MKTRRLLVELGRGVGAVLLVFLALEGILRGVYAIREARISFFALPYHATGDYGPTPPWLDDRPLIAPDADLLWRGQPNIKRMYLDFFGPMENEQEIRSLRHSFLPRLPASFSPESFWTVSTNSGGFRDGEFAAVKRPGVFRILSLGDSWTFGANVGQEESYPEQLGNLLRSRLPEAEFEVYNLGVLGYSSYNGLKLLESRALDLQPDVVILAFAMNEPDMAGYRPEAPSPETGPTLRGRFSDALRQAGKFVENHSELYQILRYWALYLRWEPRSLEEDMRRLVVSEPECWFELPGCKEGENLFWLETSLKEYRTYHLRMIDAVRQNGALPILLHNAFWQHSPYLRELGMIAESTGTPLVDASALLGTAKTEIENRLEEVLGLRALERAVRPPGEDVTFVFRVSTASVKVEEAVFITGNDERLGSLRPNTLSMYDDGTHGDQVAGDEVWSYSVTAEPGTSFFYMYTNSGSQGVWGGLGVPAVRNVRIDSMETRRVVYGPIDTFGTLYMRADPWHTNATGYRLIAEKIFEELIETPKVQTYLASRRARLKP